MEDFEATDLDIKLLFEEIDGDVETTVGVAGMALMASEGIRMPGVTFGDTGKSLSGLDRR